MSAAPAAPQSNAYPLHAAALANSHEAVALTITYMETCCTREQQLEYVQHATVVSIQPTTIKGLPLHYC